MKNVRCIKTEGSNLGKITLGKIYEVVEENSSRYVIVDDNGDKIERLKARFEVVTNSNEKPRVKVKCISGWGDEITKNQVYEVLSECPGNGMYTIINNLGKTCEWHKSRFEVYYDPEPQIMLTCIDPGFGTTLTIGCKYEVVREDDKHVWVLDNHGEVSKFAATRFSSKIEGVTVEEHKEKTTKSKLTQKVKKILSSDITKKIKHGDFISVNNRWFIYYGDFLIPMDGQTVPETQSLKKILENKKNQVKVIFVDQVTYPTTNYIPDFMKNQKKNEQFFTEFIYELDRPNPRKKALEETMAVLRKKMAEVEKRLAELED